MRHLQRTRKTERDHRRRDDDLQDDDSKDRPSAPRIARRPPNQISGDAIREQSVNPLHPRERSRRGDQLSVAQRKPAARRHRAQVRGRGTHEHCKESEHHGESGAGSGEQSSTRCSDETRKQQHGGREMQNYQRCSQTRLHRHRAEQDLNDQQPKGGIGRTNCSLLHDPRSLPSNDSQRQHQHGDHRRHQPVTPLDHGGYVTEGRKEMAVTEWPVVAASHPRSGDSHDRAEDDQQVCGGSCRPGERDKALGHGSYVTRGNPRVSRHVTLTGDPLRSYAARAKIVLISGSLPNIRRSIRLRHVDRVAPGTRLRH